MRQTYARVFIWGIVWFFFSYVCLCFLSSFCLLLLRLWPLLLFLPFSFICTMLSYYSINTISFSFSFFSYKQNDIHSTNFDVPHFFAYLCTLTHCAIVKITTNRRLNRKTKKKYTENDCMFAHVLTLFSQTRF